MSPNDQRQPNKYTFVYDSIKSVNIIKYFQILFFILLTLQLFGGTKSCVISPACTQNRCNSVPANKSHKHTAKSTPPDTKWFLSYLECSLCGYNKQFTRPPCPVST